MTRPHLKRGQDTRIVAFRLAEDDWQEFERLCSKVGKDKSEVLRPMVERWMRKLREMERAKTR